MEIRYRWERNSHYMLISAEEMLPDGYQVRMLEENRIPGLLKVRIRQINSQNELCFDITGKVSVTQRFGGVFLSAPYLRRLMAGINRIAGELEKYLLDLDNLLMDPELIFWSERDDEPEFCYCPSEKPEKDFRSRLRELFQYFLNKTDHRDEETVALVYGIYQISVKNSFQMQELMQLLFYQEETDFQLFQTRSAFLEQRRAAAENREKSEEQAAGEELDGKEKAPLLYGREKEEKICTGTGDKIFLEKQKWLDYVLVLLIVGLAAAAAAVLLIRMYRAWSNENGKELILCAAILFSVGVMTAAAVHRLLAPEKQPGKEANEKKVEKSEAERKSQKPEWREREESARRMPEAMELHETENERKQAFSMPESPAVQIWFRSQGFPQASDFLLDRNGRFLVGKEQAEIRLNRATVSRRHAILEVRGGICTVTDCGSSNGTYLNDVRLTPGEPRILLPGSIIKFAELSFRAEAGENNETQVLNEPVNAPADSF